MAMCELAACGVPADPCGAAALAGARVALTGQGSGERRAHLDLTKASTVVLLSTESSSANQARMPPAVIAR
jgi:diaminopropionate ammonia-lyase